MVFAFLRGNHLTNGKLSLRGAIPADDTTPLAAGAGTGDGAGGGAGDGAGGAVTKTSNKVPFTLNKLLERRSTFYSSLIDIVKRLHRVMHPGLAIMGLQGVMHPGLAIMGCRE